MPRKGSGDDRARAALARFEAGETLAEIGESLGVSASRVHQLVTKARKLREAVMSGEKAGKYPCTPDGR